MEDGEVGERRCPLEGRWDLSLPAPPRPAPLLSLVPLSWFFPFHCSQLCKASSYWWAGKSGPWGVITETCQKEQKDIKMCNCGWIECVRNFYFITWPTWHKENVLIGLIFKNSQSDGLYFSSFFFFFGIYDCIDNSWQSLSVVLKMLLSLLLPPLYLGGGGGERSEKCSRKAYFNANLLLIIAVLKSSQPSAEQW